MKENRTDQEEFNPLWSKEELLTTNLGFATQLVGSTDPLKVIQYLQALRIELERQNKELLRSQQELMKSKIRYTELYDTAPVGYFTLDFQGTILNANLTLADMLSMERPSLLNQHIMDYIVLEDHDIYYRHLKDLDTLKKRQVCELRMKKKDETSFDVQLETILIADRCKEPEQYRAVVIDISERKKAEKDKEKLQAKLHQVRKMKSMGTIAGGIAHNFNNILHIIAGNVELALDEIPKINPAHANLKRIKSAALRAAGIVKQLIDFSHRNSEELKPIGIVGIIKESLELLRPSIPSAIELKECFPDKEVTILADRSQMDRILTHLCTNAFQAMEGTGGQLEIRVETKALTPEDIDTFSDLTPGEYVKITFRDTGFGIHPEIIDQIFDPYFTTRGFENGSGMGLTVVHSIVKNHNGNITVESRPGKGTVFTLLLPLMAQILVAETPRKDKISSGCETILFVDDEESIIDTTKTMLEKFGYKVVTKLNPLEALDLFQSKPLFFDLVITDMSMPQMSGTKLAEKMMGIRPDTPIIICTGHNSQIAEEKARKLGIADYIIKPMSIFDMAGRIRKVLDKKCSLSRIKAV